MTRKTKPLSWAEYIGDKPLTPWNVQKEIKRQVNREAEILVQDRAVSLPKPSHAKLNTTPARIYTLCRKIISILTP